MYQIGVSAWNRIGEGP